LSVKESFGFPLTISFGSLVDQQGVFSFDFEPLLNPARRTGNVKKWLSLRLALISGSRLRGEEEKQMKTVFAVLRNSEIH
jgi:hypothetical protein